MPACFDILELTGEALEREIEAGMCACVSRFESVSIYLKRSSRRSRVDPFVERTRPPARKRRALMRTVCLFLDVPIIISQALEGLGSGFFTL